MGIILYGGDEVDIIRGGTGADIIEVVLEMIIFLALKETTR